MTSVRLTIKQSLVVFVAPYAVPAFVLGLLLCSAPAYAQGRDQSQDEASLYRTTDAFGAPIDKDSGSTAGSHVNPGSPGNPGNPGNNAKSVSGISASQSFKLSGGISHSERLEPLPESERTGAFMPPVVKQKLTIPPKRTFAAAPVIDKSIANLSDAHKQAAIKAQPAKVDTAMAEYKRNMQAVIEANLHASAVNSQRTAVPGGQSSLPKNTLLSRGASTNLNGRAATMAASMAAFKGGKGALKGAANASGKIKVPHWLAGVWQRSKSNEISRVELPSGKSLKALGEQAAVVTDVFGTFKDKNGQTWMITPTSAGGAVDRGSAVDYHRVRQYELVETGPTSCLIKVRATHYVLDKKTQRILAAYQDEEFNSYKQVSPGLVKTESSVKVFDELGAPRLLTKAVSMEKRTKQL